MQEVVIAGWLAGKGRRANRIGSLILAVPGQHGDLQHVGGVGTGFTERMLDHLAARLAPLRQEANPISTPLPRADTGDAVWTGPELVGEVAYTEWTSDGHLRHPSWRGLRPDKRQGEVHREDQVLGFRPATRQARTRLVTIAGQKQSPRRLLAGGDAIATSKAKDL